MKTQSALTLLAILLFCLVSLTATAQPDSSISPPPMPVFLHKAYTLIYRDVSVLERINAITQMISWNMHKYGQALPVPVAEPDSAIREEMIANILEFERYFRSWDEIITNPYFSKYISAEPDLRFVEVTQLSAVLNNKVSDNIRAISDTGNYQFSETGAWRFGLTFTVDIPLINFYASGGGDRCH
jgi:hypothetical protein